MQVKIHYIEAFVAQVRHRSMQHAAQALGLSQPALSKAIAALEQEVSYPLFFRDGRNLTLTPQGQKLLPHAQRILESCRAFGENAISGAEALRGSVIIGSTSTIANTILMGYITEFGKKYPQIHIRLIVGNYRRTLNNIRNHEVDIGLIAAECKESWIQAEPWREDTMVLLCAAGHPLANKPGLTRNDLIEQDWIVREPGAGSRQTVDSAFADMGLAPRIRFELGSNETIHKAIQTGLGIGFLSTLAVSDEIESGKLAILDIPGFRLTRPLTIVRMRNSQLSPAAELFIQSLVPRDREG